MIRNISLIDLVTQKNPINRQTQGFNHYLSIRTLARICIVILTKSFVKVKVKVINLVEFHTQELWANFS